jgi:hypothetical protein
MITLRKSTMKYKDPSTGEMKDVGLMFGEEPGGSGGETDEFVTREEFTTIMGNYINDINILVGGDA